MKRKKIRSVYFAVLLLAMVGSLRAQTIQDLFSRRTTTQQSQPIQQSQSVQPIQPVQSVPVQPARPVQNVETIQQSQSTTNSQEQEEDFPLWANHSEQFLGWGQVGFAHLTGDLREAGTGTKWSFGGGWEAAFGKHSSGILALEFASKGSKDWTPTYGQIEILYNWYPGGGKGKGQLALGFGPFLAFRAAKGDIPDGVKLRSFDDGLIFCASLQIKHVFLRLGYELSTADCFKDVDGGHSQFFIRCGFAIW